MEGEGIDIWDEHVLDELWTFVTKKNGRQEHDDGHHDDDVLSAAIGLLHIDSASRMPEPVRISRVPSDMRSIVRRDAMTRFSGPRSFS